MSLFQGNARPSAAWLKSAFGSHKVSSRGFRLSGIPSEIRFGGIDMRASEVEVVLCTREWQARDWE